MHYHLVLAYWGFSGFTIARATIVNPPVLILDEATSSIDTITEAIVQEGMDKLMKGRTVFVIAHRLSTIKNSDVIMVLDQGRIIERGNRDDLIDKKIGTISFIQEPLSCNEINNFLKTLYLNIKE